MWAASRSFHEGRLGVDRAFRWEGGRVAERNTLRESGSLREREREREREGRNRDPSSSIGFGEVRMLRGSEARVRAARRVRDGAS